MPDLSFKIQKFDKGLHDRSSFSCGVSAMDSFIRNSISYQIKHNRIVVWCATNEEGNLCGMYGLNAHSIRPDAADPIARRNERNDIPVTYLPFIAISKDLQGQGLGVGLMGHAIGQFVEISKRAGTAALVLDVLKDDKYERRLSFYQKIGFEPLVSSPERLYLTTKKVINSL